MSALEDALIERVRSLPAEKQQEVLDFANFLGSQEVGPPKKPLKSLRGLLKEFNLDISAEDIAEARREMWGNFPREHFFE